MEASADSAAASSHSQLGLIASNLFQSPLAALFELSGIVPSSASPSHSQSQQLGRLASGEVSIRIVGGGGDEDDDNDDDGASIATGAADPVELSNEVGDGVDNAGGEAPTTEEAAGSGGERRGDGETGPQRYDVRPVARWIEQVLPFTLLLLVVFIRQHLQGFFVTIWIAVAMFMSNDVVRRQTALKGERKVPILVGLTFASMVQVLSVYWLFRNDDLLRVLILVPPKKTVSFWHAIFITMVNDILVRQVAMAVKCLLLLYYKKIRGRNFRRQGQMLTLVEYLLLLYRIAIPAPVWYRFFLNKEYGSFFSSLTTGLYLTFKLMAIVEKIQLFLVALQALSRKAVHYGSYVTAEQAMAAGDMCAICQEKMHIPVLLRCKHIFCEDCVSEWFERERTCPLCRALVRPADIKSFSDGSTCLFFQLF